MTESETIALVVCFLLGLFVLLGIFTYLMKKQTIKKRENDFLERKIHGKLLLPGIRQFIKNWDQEYTIYFPEMVYMTAGSVKASK